MGVNIRTDYGGVSQKQSFGEDYSGSKLCNATTMALSLEVDCWGGGVGWVCKFAMPDISRWFAALKLRGITVIYSVPR